MTDAAGMLGRTRQVAPAALDGPQYFASLLGQGLAGFFRLYQPDDFPQELPISADYPVYQPITGVTGIEYMTQYLRCLAYENQFLLLFSA